MNAKDITIIVLLLVILAILYRLMQAAKLQTELTTGIAIKAGVVIPNKNKKRLKQEEEEEEKEEQEQEQEQEEQEHEEEEEIEAQEEDQNGKKISTLRAVVVKNKSEKVNKKKSKKFKPCDVIARLFTDKALRIKDIIPLYEAKYGTISYAEIWRAIESAHNEGKLKKFKVGENPNRFIYGTPEMFDGDDLKQEYKS